MTNNECSKKILCGIVIGIVVASTTSALAATTILSSNVSYSNSSSGLKSTNVQGAIDELYNMVNSKITTYEFGTPTASSSIDFQDVIDSSGSNVFSQKKGSELSICIYLNGSLSCFKNNDFTNEKVHLKEAFSSSCGEFSGNINCGNSTTGNCSLYSNGSVDCTSSSKKVCRLTSNNVVTCQ